MSAEPKFKLNRSESLSSPSNKPENIPNFGSEYFQDISNLMKQDTLPKASMFDDIILQATLLCFNTTQK